MFLKVLHNFLIKKYIDLKKSRKLIKLFHIMKECKIFRINLIENKILEKKNMLLKNI